jgi:hypothetical protein
MRPTGTGALSGLQCHSGRPTDRRHHRENPACPPPSISTRSVSGSAWASSRARAGRSRPHSSDGSSRISERRRREETFTGHVHRILQNFIGQLSKSPPGLRERKPVDKDGLPQVNIRRSGKEGDAPPAPVTLRRCRGEFCAELITSGGLQIAMSNFEQIVRSVVR